ncbi:HNH endonuclease [Natrononativus amylolyticus]|uniref:HNH endonuclease n=1 Tax=Natrononativus amylolyticus TaxID=2963434 RepID=UPI0020CBE079|nr:HNH endonuclease signature motif containing protein [Natrononativus amylolyticus]
MDSFDEVWPILVRRAQEIECVETFSHGNENDVQYNESRDSIRFHSRATEADHWKDIQRKHWETAWDELQRTGELDRDQFLELTEMWRSSAAVPFLQKALNLPLDADNGRVFLPDEFSPGEVLVTEDSEPPSSDGSSTERTPTRMTTERFFGGVDDRVQYLCLTLQFVSEHEPTEADLINWILENTPAGAAGTVKRNLSFLESVDLLESTPEGYRTTNKGETFWKQDEPLVMYEGLATAVDGFREIARAIPSGDRTIEEIQHQLRRAYPDHKLPKGVVTKHLDWLESLELVTKEDGVYSIPIEGGNFEVGERYSRWFIHDVLKGERYKGIATPSELPLIFIFTGDAGRTYGYEDMFLEGDRFLYTGEGTEGDMTMDDGNKALRDHRENGESIHLFENTDMPWIVTYLGEYEYVTHRIDTLPDEHDNPRDAFRFELAPVGGTEIEIEGGTPRSLSDSELFAKAKQSSPSGSGGSGGSGGSRSYPRSEYVREFALRTADGVCQGCGEDAPFVSTSGKPFLEVHHLTRLSDGGPDDPENVIALCPNCHRRRHEGRDGDAFNRELREKARRRNERYL